MEVKLQNKNFREIFLKFVLIIILAIVTYSNTFNASWHLDDYSSILGNHKIKNLSKTFQDIIPNPRGFCDFIFAVNYYFCGPNVFGFHVINLIIHIISTFMVYFIIRLTLIIHEGEDSDSFSSQLENLPLAGSLIFVAHPIQTQAVTYIVQRYASLATMFYLVSLIFFIKARLNLLQNNCKFFSIHHFPYYLCSFACTVLAMRTKEIAVTIPIIFLLYDFIFFKKSQKELKITLLYLFPFFILLLIILTLRVFLVCPDFTELGNAIDRGLKDPSARITRGEYAITSINVILTYIRLLFLPINQNIYHIYPISTSIFSNYTYLSFFVHIAIIIFAVVIFKISRLISFGIFWFYITISVESSIILIGDVIFEHRLYLPLVGFIIFLTGIVSLEVELKNIFYIFFLIIIAMFSVVTYSRNFIWKDEPTLWNDCLAKSKNNSIAYYNLGNFYLDQKSYDESIKQYKMALKIDPYFEEVHNNLGYTYEQKGLSDMAIDEYTKAFKTSPNYVVARINLGNLYQKKGLLGRAIDVYAKALKINPDYPETHFTLGNLYMKKGLLDMATDEYMKAINIRADYAIAHLNLGYTYYLQGRFEDAIKEYQIVIEIDPDYPPVYNNLGIIYCNQGKLEDAIKEFEIALRLKPDYFEAHYNLGVAYKRNGALSDAIEEFKNVLKINPNFVQARQAIESISK